MLYIHLLHGNNVIGLPQYAVPLFQAQEFRISAQEVLEFGDKVSFPATAAPLRQRVYSPRPEQPLLPLIRLSHLASAGL